MKKTKSPKTPPIASVDEFRAALDQVAQSTLKKAKLNLSLEKKIAALRAEADPELNALKKEIDAEIKRASKFALLKRAELFPGKAKSSFTALAEFGFRDGTPALVLMEGFEWADVVNAIQLRIEDICAEGAMLDLGSPEEIEKRVELQKWNECIVTKTEVVKDAVKSGLTDAERGTIGTAVETKESFWVKPKQEKQDGQTATVVEGEEAA